MSNLLHIVHDGYAHTGPFGEGAQQPTIFAVDKSGALRWLQYAGKGEWDPTASSHWLPNTGNAIGQGWNSIVHLLAIGKNTLLVIDPNGDMRWFRYTGKGESNPSGSTNWHPNSGNIIGRGWNNLKHVVAAPNQGNVYGHSDTGAIFVVRNDGALIYYHYVGNGEADPTGATGWGPNTYNQIANDWAKYTRVFAAGNALLGVTSDGILHSHFYMGYGESDPAGAKNWFQGYGKAVGQGWSTGHVFGGVRPSLTGRELFAVDSTNHLRWYNYLGNGPADPTGSNPLNWGANTGNQIGQGW